MLEQRLREPAAGHCSPQRSSRGRGRGGEGELTMLCHMADMRSTSSASSCVSVPSPSPRIFSTHCQRATNAPVDSQALRRST